VVNFVNEHEKETNSGIFIVRPKPSKALSPHSEKSGEYENDNDAQQPELSTFIVRPKSMALRPSGTLSPHTEESDLDESDDVESGAEASER
jgi:hypothetical protein